MADPNDISMPVAKATAAIACALQHRVLAGILLEEVLASGAGASWMDQAQGVSDAQPMGRPHALHPEESA